MFYEPADLRVKIAPVPQAGLYFTGFKEVLPGLLVPVGPGVHDSLQIAHVFTVRESFKDDSGCSVVIHLQIGQSRIDVLVFLQKGYSAFVVPILKCGHAVLILRVMGVQAFIYKGSQAADVVGKGLGLRNAVDDFVQFEDLTA